MIPAALVASAAWGGAALNITGDVGTFTDNQPRMIGWQFTPNQDIRVTNVGALDIEKDGLIYSHAVGIYTTGGTLLGSATVLAGTADPLDGFFRYAALPSPLDLTSGVTYVIGADWAANGDQWIWTPAMSGAGILSYSFDPAITGPAPGQARYAGSAWLTYPGGMIGAAFPGDPRSMFVGPNFQFGTAPLNRVPEPSTLWLAGAALLFVLRSRRWTAFTLRAAR